MNICVIPARGGSKRIPHKNIKEFCGQPMISWSIKAARDSECFDRIVVSTDDDEIEQIAVKAGAECLFRRPPQLSNDHATTRPVIAHAIHAMRDLGLECSNVCCLYATAAFSTSSDISDGLSALQRTGASYVFPVLPFPAPIERSLRLSTTGQVHMVMPEHFSTRSQDLEQAWHDAGQFYWASADTWLTDAPIFGPKAVGLPLTAGSAVDIDTEEDWQRAETAFRAARKLL